MNVKVISTIAFFLLSMSSGVLHAGQYAGATKVKLAKEGSFSLKASQSQYIREHQFELVDAIQAGDCDSVTKHYYRIMDAGQIDAVSLMEWYKAQEPKKRRSAYGKHILELMLGPNKLINARLFDKCNNQLKDTIELPKQTREEGQASKVRVQKIVDEAKACATNYGYEADISTVSAYLSSDNPDITNEDWEISVFKSRDLCSLWKDKLMDSKAKVRKKIDGFLSCAEKYGVDVEVPLKAVQFLSEENLKAQGGYKIERELEALCHGFRMESYR